MTLKIAFSLLCLIFFETAFSDTVFTYREKESPSDTRYEYDRRLLELALQKTEKEYGAFQLNPTKPGSNEKRVIVEALSGTYENFFFKSSITPELIESLAYVSFPIDRGVVGYRVAFTSKKNIPLLKETKTLEQLKQLTILQGVGWLDAEILAQQGFKLTLSGYYDPMFKMIARDRAHLFLRGINEVLDEWEAHKHIENLVVEDSIVVQYPLPRFFFTNKANKKAVKRITEGILIAYNDGSLIQLWEEKYRTSIEFANIKNRRIFRLKNPLINGIDSSYQQYNFDPLTD